MSDDEAIGRAGTYPKGVARRREILDRAFEVFAGRGFSGTSLRSIAEEIGVSHAALRHYFPSREALLLEVLRERDARDTRGDGPPDELIARISEHAARNAATPGLLALHTTMMATALQPDGERSREFFTARFARMRAESAATIAAAARDGGADPDIDPDAVAALIAAAWDGLQIQWLLDPSVDVPGTLALIERILRPASVPPAG